MRARGHVIAGLICAVIAAACGGDDDDTAGTASSLAGTSVSSAATSPAVTDAPPTTGTPPSTATPPRMVTMEFLGGPDWLAADDAAVYVKRDNGGVDQLDPETGAVTASVEVGGDLCRGLGVGFDSVWACHGGDIARIDFDANEIVATIEAGKAFEQGTLATAGGKVWVLLGDGSSIAGIDPATNELGPPADLPARGTELYGDERGLWVLSRIDDKVLRLDPDSVSVLWVAEVANAASATAAATPEGDDIWVGGTQTVRLDGRRGAVEDTIDAGPGPEGALAIDGEDLWIRSMENFLQRVDTASGEVAETVEADVTSGGGAIVAFGALWATAYDDATLVRIQLDG